MLIKSTLSLGPNFFTPFLAQKLDEKEVKLFLWRSVD
jgi:hypothetical protein